MVNFRGFGHFGILRSQKILQVLKSVENYSSIPPPFQDTSNELMMNVNVKSVERYDGFGL